MGKKLKAISEVSVALALLGAAVPAVEAAPTAMAAKKTTKKAKKSTKKVAKKTSKKKATKKKTAAKKSTKKVTKKTVNKTVKKPVKKATPASANLTFYNSKGKPTSYWPAKDGLEKAPKKGDKVEVMGQGIINGQLMYQIAQCSDVYVPAKDVKVDYFKNVGYADYDTYHYSSIPAEANVTREARLASAKANYEAELAEIEKNAKTAKDISEGLMVWFDAHPLESLREESKDVKVSKSTYEKHNLTYAQEAAQFGRMSVGFTKEAYTAYIKGEKAYRQYEAKWAAKYPNITRNITKLLDESDYKKYNLNTFEWHYNDNIYINIRK